MIYQSFFSHGYFSSYNDSLSTRFLNTLYNNITEQTVLRDVGRFGRSGYGVALCSLLTVPRLGLVGVVRQARHPISLRNWIDPLQCRDRSVSGTNQLPVNMVLFSGTFGGTPITSFFLSFHAVLISP